jgi:leader peptidase (prepilin peptidase)/N-methyltransferase
MLHFPFFYLITFLFGLAIGSFLNCIIYRLQAEKNFLRGRSFCPHCKHILSWQDLIPLLSFVILKGKCRYCGKKISCQYPLVELATGILFVLIVDNQLSSITLQNLLSTFYFLLIICFLIIIFVYDLKHYIIPDKIIYPAIITALVYNLLDTKYLVVNTAPAALGAGAFFLTIVLVSKGKWMGLGDVKLAFLMGLFLGFPNILTALFVSFLMGAIVGLGLIMAGKKTLRSEVPFAPFLVGGTFLTIFWGRELINWYLNYFNLII